MSIKDLKVSKACEITNNNIQIGLSQERQIQETIPAEVNQENIFREWRDTQMYYINALPFHYALLFWTLKFIIFSPNPPPI